MGLKVWEKGKDDCLRDANIFGCECLAEVSGLGVETCMEPRFL